MMKRYMWPQTIFLKLVPVKITPPPPPVTPFSVYSIAVHATETPDTPESGAPNKFSRVGGGGVTYFRCLVVILFCHWRYIVLSGLFTR
jgi:hypothetical protein